MPTPVLHPQWRCAQSLSHNRWRTRRLLWPQTLSYGVLSLLLIGLILWLLRQSVQPKLDSFWHAWQVHVIAVSVVLAVYGWLSARAALQSAWFAFQDGGLAALPIAPTTESRWLTYLTVRRIGGHVLASLMVFALVRHSSLPLAQQLILFLLALGAIVVGHVFARYRFRPAERPIAPPVHALQAISWPWTWLSHPALPHVPILQVQEGQSLWWAGRARAGLLVLLLLAPREALAVLVPIIGMALWYGASQLEAMHRSLYVLHELLAACPVSGAQLWRASWRAPACMLSGLLVLLAALLALIGAPWLLVLAAIVLLSVLAILDLLWCIRWRADRVRGQRARMLSLVLFLIVLQQWPIGALPLLLWLLWRATRGWST